MLDPEFVRDSPYGPGGLLLDEITTIDRPAKRIVARMPTSQSLPLTREQRVHPLHHPAHVSGGLMVHMTGMVGFAHFYYIMDYRHADGWIGYGGKIHSARFKSLAPPGEPLHIECICTQERHGPSRVLARYGFTFRQQDRVVYEGDQTAMWVRTTDAQS